jgi:tRNA threonylcarbamoyladenosine biosynthesis protein TsaE
MSWPSPTWSGSSNVPGMPETAMDRASPRAPGRSLPSVTITSRSGEDTRALGEALAGVARAGDRIALLGELGAGKTQFAKGFAVGLGVSEVVNSPSFTLMAEYEGRLPLFHLDLYRLAGAESALAGGLMDERQAEGVTLSEWAERLGGTIDQDRLEVRIGITGEDERVIEVRASSPRYARYLRQAAGTWSAGPGAGGDR